VDFCGGLRGFSEDQASSLLSETTEDVQFSTANKLVLENKPLGPSRSVASIEFVRFGGPHGGGALVIILPLPVPDVPNIRPLVVVLRAIGVVPFLTSKGACEMPTT